MRMHWTVCSLLSVVLLIQPVVSFAFETDQYNLPANPLADIGPEVSEYVEQNLRAAMSKINAEIFARQFCLQPDTLGQKKFKCNSVNKERQKLRFLQSEEAVAREVYKLLGSGTIAFTKSETWLESYHFKKQPARYKTNYQKSIYAISPVNYFTLSPTVRIYGTEFGTDKIGHFFQQGYTYYKIYNRARTNGLTPEKAVEKAVRWGQLTERTFYGTVVSGVYSNADLCANFVGMRFYQGLTKEIKIGETMRPAVLRLKDGIWTFNENIDLPDVLIKPFLSEHLNEALNPSIFVQGLRSFVRQTIRKQSCRQWLNQHPDLTQANFSNAFQALKQWYNEEYGFTESKKFVTIANTCFAD